MLKINICKLTILLFIASATFSCSFHPVIQQGNILDEATVAQIKIGMTKDQIVYLIGNPIFQDISNPNQWDYVYQKRQNTQILERKTLRLDFDRNHLIKITRPKTSPQFIKPDADSDSDL